jgi:hypothetical protein
MEYVGYAIIAITAAIVALTVFRKRKYDEYQVNILARGFIIAGVITVFLLPVALILVLSDMNYAIERHVSAFDNSMAWRIGSRPGLCGEMLQVGAL